jgi:Cu(I)/Ag(I) efflux system membrane fusion protein
MNDYLKHALLILPVSLFANEATVEQLFNVQTVKVQKEHVSEKTQNYGYVTADESRVYDISPRYGGYVVKLYADKIYKKVKKGEPLATVYSPEVFKAKDEYLNTYRYAKKRPNKGMLQSSKLKLKLLGVSDTEINEIIKTEKASENTTIYSPIDGYVFEKGIVQGSAFNAKNRLFKIVNLDEVWVEAKLFEEERTRLEKVHSYELNFKGIEKTYITKNKLLYPELDPKVATLTLRLRVINSGKELFPGMYASIASLTQTREHLILPTTAIIRKDNKYYAFIVGEFEGEYEPIEVEVKPLDSKTYIIDSGLNEGDEVVNNALFMMDSDAQINGLY